jgi:DNA-binding transcriptional LysR family regulator
MEYANASVLMNRLQAKARMRHLQVLVTVGELRSLKKTAEVIGLSQPAVTQLLADLESLLEVKLFDRFSRGMQPTRAGRELIPVAQRILEALAHGSEAISALRRQGEGSVRIAAIAGAISGLLSRAIPEFTLAHSSIQLSVAETGAMDWALQLARGEVDLAVCREPMTAPVGHVFLPVMPDRFVIACGPTHPMVNVRTLTWRMLLQRPWLPPPVGSSARTTFDRLVSAYGVDAPLSPVVTRVSNLTWAMLRHQHLLTLVPFGVVRQWVEAGELAVIEPPEPLPFSPVGLVIPVDQQSLAARAFDAFVTERDWGGSKKA